MKDEAKQSIIDIFMRNVYGKSPDVSSFLSGHDGKYGHWLEEKMGVTHNADNAPDLLGYEMKNDTTSKTTFGDWMPDVKIFGPNRAITRNQFVVAFGQASPNGPNRWSWSGSAAPKIDKWNKVGQRLVVDELKNISVIYSFDKDSRPNKSSIVPKIYQKQNLILMTWTYQAIKNKVESKFNQNGWFKCLVDPKTGRYSKIVFGEPITYENWLQRVISGEVFFDPGMHYDASQAKPNTRNYMMWRANNSSWMDLIVESYP